MKINISCVITTHNRDEYLKEAIHSVINQTFLPLEIIVSNNVPNKKTQTIIETISKKTSISIIYFEHRMKGRGSASVNLASFKTKGDYIAFLDDDDMWEKSYLEKMSILISEKKSKIIYSWISKIQNNKKTHHKKLKENLPMKDFILTNPGCGVSNLVVDRKLFIGLGGFDDYINPSYDKDFLLRALYYDYTYDVLKENLVIERKHEHQQVTDINKDFLIGMKSFFKKHEWIASPTMKIRFWIKYWKNLIKMLEFNKIKS